MEDISYFKEMLLSIHDFSKIVLIIFIIKRDDELLTEMGLKEDFIKKNFIKNVKKY